MELKKINLKVQRNCAKTGRILLSFSFHLSFQVVLMLYEKKDIRYFKQSHRSSRNVVNNFGTKFLSTCYSNF